MADRDSVLVVQGSLSNGRAMTTQALHDYGQSRGRSGSGDSAERDEHSDAAAALHVDGFDAEQIWGQLEAHGGSVLRRVRKLVARAGLEPHLLTAAAVSRLEGMCPPHLSLSPPSPLFPLIPRTGLTAANHSHAQHSRCQCALEGGWRHLALGNVSGGGRQDGGDVVANKCS